MSKSNGTEDRLREILLRDAAHGERAKRRFSSLLNGVMAERELTATKLAKRLRVPPNLVYQWRLGRCIPRRKKLASLMRELSWSLAAVEDVLT